MSREEKLARKAEKKLIKQEMKKAKKNKLTKVEVAEINVEKPKVTPVKINTKLSSF